MFFTHRRVLIPLLAVNDRVPYQLGASGCRIENVIVLGEIPPSLSLDLNRVFTLENRPGCFLFHMDVFLKTALTHRPVFGDDYPDPLRGSDGPVLNFVLLFIILRKPFQASQ